jgi:hypothetical protein
MVMRTAALGACGRGGCFIYPQWQQLGDSNSSPSPATEGPSPARLARGANRWAGPGARRGDGAGGGGGGGGGPHPGGAAPPGGGRARPGQALGPPGSVLSLQLPRTRIASVAIALAGAGKAREHRHTQFGVTVPGT